MTDFSDFDLSAYWQEPDFLLTDLVSLLANRSDSQMGITLMVKGAILTGTLVGEREYLRRVNDMFKRMARETLTKPTKEDLASIDEAFGFDELIEDRRESPDTCDVFLERCALVLGEHFDACDAGIDEVRQDDVDNAVAAAKGNRRLGAVEGERK